jgi:hypothetical protein
MEILHKTDDKGKEVAIVPLMNSTDKATIYEDDFRLLMGLGLLPYWKWSTGQVCVGNGNGNLSIARLLLDAGKGQKVVYLDQDRTNLRRENLVLSTGGGKSRTRDQIVITHKLRSNRPGIKHVKTSSGAGSVYA